MNNLPVIVTCGTIALMLLLVGVENVMRNKNPNSMGRPSNFIMECSNKLKEGFKWVGYQIARITDLVYFIKEYIFEDLKNLALGTVEVLISPWYLIKGYYNYYLGDISLLSYGVLSTSGFVTVIAVATYYVYRYYYG
jgi:hypothetical protein